MNQNQLSRWLTGVHCDKGQHSETLSCDDGESDVFCIFLNWLATKCFQDFCFGELVSLSDPSLFDELSDDADTRRFCGAFRLFVTGDWPDGDRDPKWYFRCVFEGSGDGFSSLQFIDDACTDSKAATRCGSAFWAPMFVWHSWRYFDEMTSSLWLLSSHSPRLIWHRSWKQLSNSSSSRSCLAGSASAGATRTHYHMLRGSGTMTSGKRFCAWCNCHRWHQNSSNQSFLRLNRGSGDEREEFFVFKLSVVAIYPIYSKRCENEITMRLPMIQLSSIAWFWNASSQFWRHSIGCRSVAANYRLWFADCAIASLGSLHAAYQRPA